MDDTFCKQLTANDARSLSLNSVQTQERYIDVRNYINEGIYNVAFGKGGELGGEREYTCDKDVSKMFAKHLSEHFTSLGFNTTIYQKCGPNVNTIRVSW